MNFQGRLGDTVITDPEAWPAAVKASPPAHAKGDRYVTSDGERRTAKGGEPIRMTSRGVGIEYAFPARVTLTKDEKEWLGATVRRSDGSVGQVWALEFPGYVWVVADGDYWPATPVRTLTKLSGRLDPLDLE